MTTAGCRAPSTALRLLVLTVGVAAVLASAVIALGTGPVHVPAGQVLEVVARRMQLIGGAGVTPMDDEIVWQLRLPRIVAAMAVGAALAQCGCVLQSLTRNDLADPYLFGVSSGAAVGAVSALILGWTLPGIPSRYGVAGTAFVGALVALVLVLALATGRSGQLPPGRTILAGVAVGQLCSAATSFIVIVLGPRDGARAVLDWTLGSFAGVRGGDAVFLVALLVAAMIGLGLCAPALDAFAFGEVSARSLGVNVTTIRWILLTGTALMTAATVAVVGPIGFVGLVVPHVVRLVTGPGHRILLPASAICGALLMLWSDTAARTLGGGSEIPIGVVTAAVGTPVLIVLLRRQARRA
ncbi:FecCD family ABC transporter permease [Flexivirga aerilata]|uniref:FecCD family ABC transporter permease n=1 Tax=Flexivirga aerilata TaxID=1656889 RepID=UPI0031B59053